MAEKGGQDLFSKLADRGEDVIGRINELNIPGSQKLVESANQLRDRADELQRKLRGLDALERRVDALEKKVDELSRASTGAKQTTTKRTTPAKPKTPS
jgi:cell division septum initiation protein DivIVA